MWQVSDSIAQLLSDRLAGSVDLSQPRLGFSPSDSRPIAIPQMLGVWFDQRESADEPQLVEAHVRGGDLIARYAEDEKRQVRAEIYWRALEQTPLSETGIELIASVQTSKLTSRPRLSTNSRVNAAEVLLVESHAGGACRAVEFESADSFQLAQAGSFILFRLENSALSYCEMVQPTDFVSSTMRQVNEQHCTVISHELFPNSLEKGVIRRGRVRGIFVPREQDIDRAREHFREFAASKPVLSA